MFYSSLFCFPPPDPLTSLQQGTPVYGHGCPGKFYIIVQYFAIIGLSIHIRVLIYWIFSRYKHSQYFHSSSYYIIRPCSSHLIHSNLCYFEKIQTIECSAFFCKHGSMKAKQACYNCFLLLLFCSYWRSSNYLKTAHNGVSGFQITLT